MLISKSWCIVSKLNQSIDVREDEEVDLVFAFGKGDVENVKMLIHNEI